MEISQYPWYVPGEAIITYQQWAPDKAKITVNGKPYSEARQSTKQAVNEHYKRFAALAFFSDSSEDLWQYWNQYYGQNSAADFIDILWAAYGPQRDVRQGIAKARKTRQKERISTHAQKLLKLVNDAQYIEGLAEYAQKSKLSETMEALCHYLSSARYGVGFKLSDANYDAEYRVLLTSRKSNHHIDFQRSLAEQFTRIMPLKNDKKLGKLVLLATDCFFEEKMDTTADDLRRTLRKNKARSRKK